jgi:hypothetical protein
MSRLTLRKRQAWQLYEGRFRRIPDIPPGLRAVEPGMLLIAILIFWSCTEAPNLLLWYLLYLCPLLLTYPTKLAFSKVCTRITASKS